MNHGVVVWILGLPSSGKSTLAAHVAAKLDRETVLVLDGDAVRDVLRPRPGYDDASRSAFYESLAGLAALAADQGHVVLVPATAHRRAFRERARGMTSRYVEVLVDTPPGECARRDAKGLYADDSVRPELPGVGVPFERPEAPDVVVRPGDPDAAQAVVAAIRRVALEP